MPKFILPALLLSAIVLPAGHAAAQHTAQQKEWAMAVSAIPVESNGGSHEVLGIFGRSGEVIRSMSEMLSLEAAATVQKSFESWDEFGTNYLTGRRFWGRTGTHVSAFPGEVSKGCSTSTWRKLPWRFVAVSRQSTSVARTTRI